MTADRSQGSPRIEVFDDPDAHAYVVTVDGRRAGKAVYHLRGGRHFFVHTEVDDEYSGRGLATTLVKQALDDVGSSGGTIVPICPLVAAYIERHPEYQDMVDHVIMERINQAQAIQDPDD